MYSFSYLEPVCCSMSRSNCCFLTCIQISQEAGQVVWYSHLFQNFPQFIVIHTVKGFGIVNKEEIDVFLELSCFFDDPADVGNLISGSSAFSKTSLNIRSGAARRSHPMPKARGGGPGRLRMIRTQQTSMFYSYVVLLIYVDETIYLLGNLSFFKIHVNVSSCFMAWNDSTCASVISKCMLWVRGLVPVCEF